jgi:hypothetical protein
MRKLLDPIWGGGEGWAGAGYLPTKIHLNGGLNVRLGSVDLYCWADLGGGGFGGRWGRRTERVGEEWEEEEEDDDEGEEEEWASSKN